VHERDEITLRVDSKLGSLLGLLDPDGDHLRVIDRLGFFHCLAKSAEINILVTPFGLRLADAGPRGSFKSAWGWVSNWGRLGAQPTNWFFHKPASQARSSTFDKKLPVVRPCGPTGRPAGKRWELRLHEKGGKFHESPTSHNAEEYLDDYIQAAALKATAKPRCSAPPQARSVSSPPSHSAATTPSIW
jgi:hypothetical protein